MSDTRMPQGNLNNWLFVQQFVKSLSVSQDDETVKDAKKVVDIMLNLCDDAYLCRAMFWGMATAMENQIVYLGTNLLVNAERKLSRLTSDGIMGESDLDVSWFANEAKAHINDENAGDQIAQAEAFIEQTQDKMRTAAILFVVYMRAHDEQSALLNQLTYSAIKAKANTNRTTRAA